MSLLDEATDRIKAEKGKKELNELSLPPIICMAKNNTANTNICKNKQLFHIPRVIEREMSSEGGVKEEGKSRKRDARAF